MASLNKDTKGWRLTFYDSSQTRKQIRLGRYGNQRGSEHSSEGGVHSEFEGVWHRFTA